MTMNIIGGFQKNNKYVRNLGVCMCNDTSIYKDYVVKIAIYLYHHSLYSLREHDSDRQIKLL